MKFRELINIMKQDGGLNDHESKDALELMVESLAVRLDEGERQDFASQLPRELQDIALSVMPTKDDAERDIIEEFMEIEDVDETHAKQHIIAAWSALKEAISESEIRHILAQLPRNTVAALA